MAETTGPGPSGAKVASAGALLVVDVGKKQRRKNIRALRKGEGKLFDKISSLVNELKENGTVKGDAQPLVIVVREKERRLLAW